MQGCRQATSLQGRPAVDSRPTHQFPSCSTLLSGNSASDEIRQRWSTWAAMGAVVDEGGPSPVLSRNRAPSAQRRPGGVPGPVSYSVGRNQAGRSASQLARRSLGAIIMQLSIWRPRSWRSLLQYSADSATGQRRLSEAGIAAASAARHRSRRAEATGGSRHTPYGRDATGSSKPPRYGSIGRPWSNCLHSSKRALVNSRVSTGHTQHAKRPVVCAALLRWNRWPPGVPVPRHE